MNISNVSFKGHINNYQYNSAPKRHSSSSLERTPSTDRYEQTRVRNKKRKKTNSPINKISTFAAGAAAATLLNLFALKPSPAEVVTIPYQPSVSISEIAEIYDTDYNAILECNGITSETDLDDLEELTIPTIYDYLGDEIEELQEKLFDKHLSEEKRNEIEERIKLLNEKHAIQQELATVYTDGKYVYFQIKELDGNTPEPIRSRFKNGINVEVFKSIFDIKDKYIKNYNSDLIDGVWVDTEPDPDGHRGMFDFTMNTLCAGETIKVPLRAINDDINLNCYYLK